MMHFPEGSASAAADKQTTQTARAHGVLQIRRRTLFAVSAEFRTRRANTMRRAERGEGVRGAGARYFPIITRESTGCHTPRVALDFLRTYFFSSLLSCVSCRISGRAYILFASLLWFAGRGVTLDESYQVAVSAGGRRPGGGEEFRKGWWQEEGGCGSKQLVELDAIRRRAASNLAVQSACPPFHPDSRRTASSGSTDWHDFRLDHPFPGGSAVATLNEATCKASVWSGVQAV